MDVRSMKDPVTVLLPYCPIARNVSVADAP
jgi:hypothetical protein